MADMPVAIRDRVEFLVADRELAERQHRGTDAARIAKHLTALGVDEKGEPLHGNREQAAAARQQAATEQAPAGDKPARQQPPRQRQAPRSAQSATPAKTDIKDKT